MADEGRGRWLDKPIYVVEEIHPDGTRTVRWPPHLALPASRWRGWRLIILVAWDALLGRRGSDGTCTHCGAPLHQDGYCTPYPDKREDLL